MQKTIEALLDLAIMAPSGDNCQPWRFATGDKQVELFNDPTADTSYYNYKQRASYVANGAVLENISIAAPQFGFDATFKYFPDGSASDHIAQITLVEGISKAVELAGFIEARGTNRKMYRGGVLDDSQLQDLSPIAEDLPDVSALLFNKRRELDSLAEVICLSDRLVYENRKLHDFLYEHIRWSDNEASTTRDGLDIKTLELSAIDTMAFKLLKNWPLTKILGKLGASRAIAANARKLAMSASAIGVIVGHNAQDPVTYLQAGRLLQRLWLQATRIGLSFHPMSGICFLMQRVLDNDAGELTLQHARLIKDAIDRVAVVTADPAPNVIGLFRVGVADQPTVRSQRKTLSEMKVNLS